MSNASEKQIWKEPAFLVGIGLTVLVLGGFAYTLFLWPMNDVYATKWAYLRNAQPNEIGDTLAGVAGTLAFVWIVVTVWLQATELREQRQEFNRMSVAQEAQAEVLEKQREIFQDEQRERNEVRAEKLLLEICEEVNLAAEKMSSIMWFNDAARSVESNFNFELPDYGERWDSKLEAVCYSYYRVDSIEWRCRDAQLFPDVTKPPYLKEFRVALEEILELKPKVSEPIHRRLDRIQIEELLVNVQKLEVEDVFWLRPIGGTQ